MKLDVYRSCSWVEKRDVLEVFWRRQADAPDRIRKAALQYGPWAVLSLAILAIEPVPVLVLSLGRVEPLVVGAGVIEAVVVASLWWATMRLVTLRRTSMS